MAAKAHLMDVIFLGDSHPKHYDSYRNLLDTQSAYTTAIDLDNFMTEICVSLMDRSLIVTIGGIEGEEFAPADAVIDMLDFLGFTKHRLPEVKWFGISGERRGAVIEVGDTSVYIVSCDPIKAQVMYELHVLPKLRTMIQYNAGNSADTKSCNRQIQDVGAKSALAIKKNMCKAGKHGKSNHEKFAPTNDKSDRFFYEEDVTLDVLRSNDLRSGPSKTKKETQHIKKFRIVERLVGIIAIVACVVCFVLLAMHIGKGDADQAINNELSQMYQAGEELEASYANTIDPQSIQPQNIDADGTGAAQNTNADSPPATTQSYTLQVSGQDYSMYGNINKKFYKLYSANSDIIGWLRIPSTNVDYPVVKTTDNDFYLNHNYYKQSSKQGTLFADYRNSINPMLSTNTSIYGHNTTNGSMFAQLKKYRDINFFKQHPTFYFNTLYENINWVVLAVFITNADPKQDNGNFFEWRMTDFGESEQYNKFLQDCRKRSLYTVPIDVFPGESLVTLTTCTDDFENARLVVVAKRQRADESIAAAAATPNATPLYPKAWHDKNGGTNTNPR